MNYIPDADPAFNTWQTNFLDAVVGSGAGGLSSAQVTALQGKSVAWANAYANQQAALAAAKAATDTKNAAREDYVALLRADVAIIQADPATTDAVRDTLGITVKAHAPSPPLPAPTSFPVLSVDMGTRLMHVIAYVNAGASKAKPAGVMGCELWTKVGGPAPVDNTGMTFLALNTRSPHTVTFGPAEVGEMVYYLGRWVSTKGEHGPWGAVASATVGG